MEVLKNLEAILAEAKAAAVAAANEMYEKKGFDLWNPCGLHVQNIDIKEAGAEAYAKVLRNYGFDAYMGSRLD